jgi:hypothetical protein
MSEQPVTETVVTEEPKPVELSMLEKAKLISDLASAFQDKEIIALFMSRNNGAKIKELYESAINNEMAAIMSGEATKKIPPVTLLHNQVEAMANAMSNFHQVITSFMNSPLVQVLGMMNQNLGGEAPKAMPQPQQYPVQQAPQQQVYRDAVPTQTRGHNANKAGFF